MARIREEAVGSAEDCDSEVSSSAPRVEGGHVSPSLQKADIHLSVPFPTLIFAEKKCTIWRKNYADQKILLEDLLEVP